MMKGHIEYPLLACLVPPPSMPIYGGRKFITNQQFVDWKYQTSWSKVLHQWIELNVSRLRKYKRDASENTQYNLEPLTLAGTSERRGGLYARLCIWQCPSIVHKDILSMYYTEYTKHYTWYILYYTEYFIHILHYTGYTEHFT